MSQALLGQLVVDACRTLQSLSSQASAFEEISAAMVACLRRGGKILTCGNGGSAADAMHLAEELVGRYKGDRVSWPALSLSSDGTLITCIANDYGYDAVFARQIEGLGTDGDVLVCFSTSGNSATILRALAAARAKGLRSVALLGKDGGKARGQADFELIVDSADTARIQEAHTLLLHGFLEVIESALAKPAAAQ